MRLEARKFDVEIICTLRNFENDQFTVSEVTDCLLSAYPNKFENSQKIARSYVHAQFKRLEKLDCIERKNCKDNSKPITYILTSKFEETIEVKNDSKQDSVVNLAFQEQEPSINKTISQLSMMVQEYNVELLSYLGESEEYNRIYESFPTLKKPLKEQLKLAQDKSAKLIGSIRALETAIEIEKQRGQ